MAKLYLTILLSLLCTIGIQAQKLNVESFVAKTNDITARTQPRKDINKNDCALVKVQLAAPNAVFEGNVVGDVAYNTSEYLVYMAQGSKKLTVKLEGYLPLEVGFQDYDIMSLEPKTVYLLTISGVMNGKEQEPVRTKTGWIVLDSEPSGASVYINDEFVGNTPLSNYKQAFGTYQYRLESLNYHSATGIIELNAGRFEQKVVLKPAFGSISVNSSIAGAKIILDGKNTGKQSPATLTEIPSGPHSITLQMDKYAPKQQDVTVEDGQTANVSMTLDARFARITINSLEGAEIYSNGKLLGKGRILEDMMEGYYDLEARLNHHKSATKQIQVIAGQSQDISLNPIPKYGSLDIVSTPHDASITIDGKSYGKTPLTVEQLLEGEHHVALFLEGYTKETRYVSVNEKESASIEIVLSKEVTEMKPELVETKATAAKQTQSTANEISKRVLGIIGTLSSARDMKEGENRYRLRNSAITDLKSLSQKDPQHKAIYSEVSERLGMKLAYSNSSGTKILYNMLIKKLRTIVPDVMDTSVLTGAYEIVGTEKVVKVKEGDNLEKISRKFLGPDMEHYLEIYNGLKVSSPLKVGQEIKIPKLQRRRDVIM